MTAATAGAALRVGVVAHYYPPHVGGLEVVAQRVATDLAGRGHEVEVLTSASPGRPGTAEEDGVNVRRLRVGNWFEPRGIPFPVFGPSLLWHAWRLARRSDVVHVHDFLYVSSWVAALACRLTRTPYVVTQHVGMVDHPSRVVALVQLVVLRTVGALVMRGAVTALPISPVIEAWTHARLPGVRTRVLRNGIDRERFRPPEPGEREATRQRLGLPLDELLVLYVGRFVPKKGYDVVSAAADPGYRLVFVGGEGPDSGTSTYLGALPADEVAEVYRACDVFVCASTGEGPMTPMEALLCGCAVLVRDDPSIRALGLADGVEELAMTPESLRARLRELAGDPAAVAALQARGQEVARTIPTWDDHLEVLESVLRDASTGRQGRHAVRAARSRPQRVALWAGAAVALLAVLGSALVVLRVSAAAQEVLEVPGEVWPSAVEVTAVGDGELTISEVEGGPTWLEDDSVYGLDWGDGWGRLGAVVDDQGASVSREFRLVAGEPPLVGDLARFSKDAYALQAPRAFPGRGAREVAVPGPDGELPAWFVPGDDSKPWMVLVHGRGAARSEMFRLMGSAVALEMPSLAITYRGDPETGGGDARVGLTEWRDVEAAVRHARAQGAGEVVLAGSSMGASLIAAFLERSDLAGAVSALVLDSPLLDLREALDLAADHGRLSGLGFDVPGPLASLGLGLAQARSGLDFDRVDYLDDTSWLRRPALVLHGELDDVVPVGESRRLQQAAPGRVRLEEIPDAGHVAGWNVDPVRYDALVRDFISSRLPRSAA